MMMMIIQQQSSGTDLSILSEDRSNTFLIYLQHQNFTYTPWIPLMKLLIRQHSPFPLLVSWIHIFSTLLSNIHKLCPYIQTR
jgi:hypothetical protein